MRAGDRPIRNHKPLPGGEKKPKPPLKKVLPQVWALFRPRLGLVIGSFLLMVLNRACGLVLPASSRYLIDNVMYHGQSELLPKIIGIVAAATMIQGITTYALSQLLSTEGQKLIAELRRKVQEHIGRLPVEFYDRNRTGVLVSRIMSDVEGVRNIIGTGLVEFVGGLMTALIAFIVLIRLSTRMTLLTFSILLIFAVILMRAFKTIRPIFRQRGAISAEVTGRLTESLGGVRVVKGYHAEESEANVFAAGVQRLLKNVLSSLRAQSLMTLSSTMVLGVVGGLVMYLGGREHTAGRLTVGGYVEYTMFLTFMIAPMVQLVSIGTQLTEAAAGLDRTNEVLTELTEDAGSKRKVELGTLLGDVRFEHVSFEYEEGKPVLHDVDFVAKPGTSTAWIWRT
jgi:subfamily B ATP-binding cassette protein MsbA